MADTTLAARLAPRAQLVGRAALAGAVVSAFGVALVTIFVGDATFASEQVFSIAALIFGFGLLGWSGSAMMGRSIETAQEHLDTDSDWTEASSRRAMARITAFGIGGMVGAIVGTILLG